MEIEEAHIGFFRSCQYGTREQAEKDGGYHHVMADGIYGYNTLRYILGAMEDVANCLDADAPDSIRVNIICDGNELPESTLACAAVVLEEYHDSLDG